LVLQTLEVCWTLGEIRKKMFTVSVLHILALYLYHFCAKLSLVDWWCAILA
jgi:hypothetical protein